MKKNVGLWVLYLSTSICAYSQVDTAYIYNTNMPYGTLDLRLAKSDSRYYYLQEGATFSYRESSPGVKTNTYVKTTTWDTSPYGEGNLREKNGSTDKFVMNYRLLKPQNYNASWSPGYPIIIMLHGGGEAANCWVDASCYWATSQYNPITNSPPAPTDPDHKLLNNDRSLLHGGSVHLSAVNLAGSKLPDNPALDPRAFPGFVLFPQSLNGWGSNGMVEDAIRILRLIIKEYNIDENRVYIHGLSNGGGGVYQALKRAPWLFAAALPMSAVNDGGIVSQGMIPEVSKLPLWIFQGGQDTSPTPGRTYNTIRHFRDAGAVVRYYLYPDLGHGTWNTAYKEPDFFSWILSQRKYNPHVSFGNPVICNPTQRGAEISFSKGYFAYQWQCDGLVITGENDAAFIANTPGTYRGRFSRKPNPSEDDWERWSDPVVVSEMNPVKPLVEVIGTAHLRGPGLVSTTENNTVKLKASQSAELYYWYKNGEQINFTGTDVEDTLRLASFTNAFSGSNGAYTLITKTSYCPSPPSDPVSLFFNNSSPRNLSVASGSLNFHGMVTASSIFLTWNDVSGLETGYEIWQRKAGTPDFVFVTKTMEDAISWQDTGLAPGTTYEYKLRAINNTGSSNYAPSDELHLNYQFTTANDFHFPPPPQDLIVVANTLNAITLSWKAAEDENSVKQYYVYYNQDSISTGSNATTYTLEGLSMNTAFPIVVKAVDYGNHFSQASNQVMATTYLVGLVYKHSTGAWEDLDDSAMVATWAHPEFTGKVSNFTLQPRSQDDYFNFQFNGYINIEAEGTYFFNITSNDGSRLILDSTIIADNDGIHGNRTVASEAVYLTAGPHAIEVQYFDVVDSHTLSVRYKGPGIGDGATFVAVPDVTLRSGVYIPPPSPSPPSGLAVSSANMDQIGIGWQFADDAQTDYEVYRATTAKGPFNIVARAAGITAIDSIGLIPGTLYYYKIRTVNSNGVSVFTPVVSASTTTDTVAPGVPQELVLIGKTLTNLTFSWQPSADNVAVTGYEIFSGGELIGTSGIYAFTAEGLSPETQYIFTVRAIDASGNRSAPSDQLVVVTNTSAVFYSSATGNLNELSSWHRNPNGTGESPQNFSDNGQYFMVTNRTAASLGGAWTIGGTSSRVIVTSGVTLTADHLFSAYVELQGTATLNLNHTTAPDLLKLSPTSTVNFNTFPSVFGGTYGNIILSGTVSKTFEADTIAVLGDLTVKSGLALKGSPHNSSHLRLAGKLILQGTRAATAADNGVDIAFIGNPTQSVATESDLFVYRIVTSPNQVVSITGPSGTPVKVNVGSLNGGGLVLANGSVFNLGINDLIMKEAATINPGAQTGSLSVNGGRITITSTSNQQSNLYFDPVHHHVSYLQIDLTGAGNVLVRAPLQISDGIKMKNGTLVSGSNITLLSTKDKTAAIYEIENGGTISGDIRVQQYLEPRGVVYRYLSTSVSGVTVGTWQESFPVTGQFSGASAGTGLTASPSLFSYWQADGGWAAYPPAGGSNTAPIEKGLGYAALLRNSTDPVMLQVKGPPFQGSILFAPGAGSSGVSNNGWNLIGNPYASPVLWNDDEMAWTRLGVNQVAAVRHNKIVNGQMRSQVVYYDILLGGGVIPAGQAFWVKTFTLSPSLGINEKAKVNPETNEPGTPSVNYMVVNLKQGEVSDPAYILLDDLGSDGYDVQYDGRKLKNYGMFNLSTIVADTVLLAVNNLTSEFCTKTVKLNVADVMPGSYTFSFENLSSMQDIGEIVLRDNYIGTSTTIDGQEYTFSVTGDANTFGSGRFAITFTRVLLDLTTPQIVAGDICAPGPGQIAVTHSQKGVFYRIINTAGNIISSEVEGNGETVILDILSGELVPGANILKMSAGFKGCTHGILPGEATVNYIPELSVSTQGDISICEGADVTLKASGAPVGGFYKWFNSRAELIEGVTTASLVVSDVFIESVYYVSAAHPNGCESEPLEIHIYADTLDMPIVLMKDDTLYTEGVGYYQWKKDGAPIAGATFHYYRPAESGVYTLVASNGGCFKESAPFGFSAGDPVTDTDNGYNNEFVLSIFPVPSAGHALNVMIRSPKSASVLIEIVDAMGRVHFSESYPVNALANGLRVVPLTPLCNGMYVVQATQADINVRKKIIVKD